MHEIIYSIYLIIRTTAIHIARTDLQIGECVERVLGLHAHVVPHYQGGSDHAPHGEVLWPRASVIFLCWGAHGFEMAELEFCCSNSRRCGLTELSYFFSFD